ncbi:MAG TPA: sigma-54-dependent Fis family transcriptional regulator [Myxococcales bacterium]|nr:sigma-54-dependent Fis family transcriptional regulator [Myxococcales bacterium]HIK84826.1 sigma-54-dependent Fis family transcriptional regulator [Myxococcales bacterium]
MERSVLVVDDEALIRSTIRRTLRKHQYKVFEAASCSEALEILDSSVAIDVVLLDLNLPDGLGWNLIEAVQDRADRPGLIIVTGEGRVGHAVTALRRGASDFLMKPFTPSQLEDALARALTEPALRGSMPLAPEPIDLWRADYAQKILGNHPTVLRMLEMIRHISRTTSSVLVTGESGTGKELVAHAIHSGSERRQHPLIVVNCAAIPENLIESELFGHSRGAFTGAMSARKGLFFAADGGTIFLDEIGELPLSAQSKLLRVIQEREVLPLGENHAVKVDVRIIAATNVDLEDAVAEGRFREDLYYRLNVIPIEVPPLRRRRSDIPDLLASFLSRFNKRLGCEIGGLDSELMGRLVDYDWPGNIRELENVLEQMVVLRGSGHLGIVDLPERLGVHSKRRFSPGEVSLPEEGLVLRSAVESFERSLIEQALTRAHGNTAAAARLIDVNRTTLITKIGRLSIDTNGVDGSGAEEREPSGHSMSEVQPRTNRKKQRVEVQPVDGCIKPAWG